MQSIVREFNKYRVDPLAQNIPYLFYRKIIFEFADPSTQKGIINFSLPVGFRGKINFLTIKKASIAYGLRVNLSRSSSNHEYFGDMIETNLFCRKNNEMLLNWHNLGIPIEFRENFSLKYFCIPIGVFRSESIEFLIHCTLEREREMQVA